MITAAQLDVLFERAVAAWLASIGIAGPPPRVAQTATKIATAARRVAAQG